MEFLKKRRKKFLKNVNSSLVILPAWAVLRVLKWDECYNLMKIFENKDRALRFFFGYFRDDPTRKIYQIFKNANLFDFQNGEKSNPYFNQDLCLTFLSFNGFEIASNKTLDDYERIPTTLESLEGMILDLYHCDVEDRVVRHPPRLKHLNMELNISNYEKFTDLSLNAKLKSFFITLPRSLIHLSLGTGVYLDPQGDLKGAIGKIITGSTDFGPVRAFSLDLTHLTSLTHLKFDTIGSLTTPSVSLPLSIRHFCLRTEEQDEKSEKVNKEMQMRGLDELERLESLELDLRRSEMEIFLKRIFGKERRNNNVIRKIVLGGECFFCSVKKEVLENIFAQCLRLEEFQIRGGSEVVECVCGILEKGRLLDSLGVKEHGEEIVMDCEKIGSLRSFSYKFEKEMGDRVKKGRKSLTFLVCGFGKWSIGESLEELRLWGVEVEVRDLNYLKKLRILELFCCTVKLQDVKKKEENMKLRRGSRKLARKFLIVDSEEEEEEEEEEVRGMEGLRNLYVLRLYGDAKHVDYLTSTNENEVRMRGVYYPRELFSYLPCNIKELWVEQNKGTFNSTHMMDLPLTLRVLSLKNCNNFGWPEVQREKWWEDVFGRLEDLERLQLLTSVKNVTHAENMVSFLEKRYFFDITVS